MMLEEYPERVGKRRGELHKGGFELPGTNPGLLARFSTSAAEELEATLEAAERTDNEKLGRVVYAEAVGRDIEYLRTRAAAAFEVDPHPVARVGVVLSKLSETGLPVSSSRNPRLHCSHTSIGLGRRGVWQVLRGVVFEAFG
ncbi:MAG: hypothetical protein M3M97_07715 [Actinomycetota bacterium]|nr:hypothetical protein [Actinomycetota bacterium]